MGLSLNVGRLNSNVTDALHLGAVLPAAVRGVEDHGYSVTFGIKVGTRCTEQNFPWLTPSLAMWLDCTYQSGGYLFVAQVRSCNRPAVCRLSCADCHSK